MTHHNIGYFNIGFYKGTEKFFQLGQLPETLKGPLSPSRIGMIAYTALYPGQTVLQRINICINIKLRVIRPIKIFSDIRKGTERGFYLMHASQPAVSINAVRSPAYPEYIISAVYIHTKA